MFNASETSSADFFLFWDLALSSFTTESIQIILKLLFDMCTIIAKYDFIMCSQEWIEDFSQGGGKIFQGKKLNRNKNFALRAKFILCARAEFLAPPERKSDKKGSCFIQYFNILILLSSFMYSSRFRIIIGHNRNIFGRKENKIPCLEYG